MDDIIHQTRTWVKDFVIKLNLCPFAAVPLQQGAVRFVVSTAVTEEDILVELMEEVQLLDTLAHQTTLLIIPQMVENFSDYLDLFDLSEQLLHLQGQQERYQLASFHPAYQFAETDADDPANATNRSPYPLIHILRCSDVADAIEKYPDTLSIPERNIALLTTMAEKK